ncbi:hypothetical protein I7I48_03824 [Histoplasma ohiense]|nr:hypothetical protein I7I48_03824 [Histoplasma ohiense (nom. inval.)]
MVNEWGDRWVGQALHSHMASLVKHPAKPKPLLHVHVLYDPVHARPRRVCVCSTDDVLGVVVVVVVVVVVPNYVLEENN